MRFVIQAACLAAVLLTASRAESAPAPHDITAPPPGWAPTLLADPAFDQGVGPDYADMVGAGMTDVGHQLIVAQRVRGAIPDAPAADFPGYSWRFDTDLNTNTGYRQFDYIGIDWEILVLPLEGGWSIAKWSPAGGTVPLPGATLYIQHQATGDAIGVRFDAAEIGRPPYLDWIAYNGGPGWEDVAPDHEVSWWER